MTRPIDPASPLARAAAALAAAEHVCVLTGAGVSAESGVPTFRDALTGYWSHLRAEDMATPDGFRAQPGVVQAWYRSRIAGIARVAPNDGHRALADLATRMPAFTLVTQNVDDLHERAGSTAVIHLHGRLPDARCLDCGANAVLPPLDGTVDAPSPERGDGVHCDACGGWVRPAVVWFGEALPEGAFEGALNAATTADVLIVAGTSGQVHPAAGLVGAARSSGAFVVEVNPEPAYEGVADAVLAGRSGEVLPRLVASLDALRAGRRARSGPDPART